MKDQGVWIWVYLKHFRIHLHLKSLLKETFCGMAPLKASITEHPSVDASLQHFQIFQIPHNSRFVLTYYQFSLNTLKTISYFNKCSCQFHWTWCSKNLGSPLLTWLGHLSAVTVNKNLRTGVLSGTLSLAFNQLNMDPTMPFSEAYALASAFEEVDCCRRDWHIGIANMLEV